jgi:hypothetical protein
MFAPSNKSIDGKNMKRTTISQQEKYIGFKKAFETITHYLEQDDLLAAYVIAFSLVEDRVRAMFVVWHRDTKKNEPTLRQVAASFSGHVDSLRKAGDISQSDAQMLLDEARIRNELLHSAMWNLEAFDKTATDRIIKAARCADKLRRAQKKKRGQ